MSNGKIILDNGGGVTLQLGGFAHYYNDPKHAAVDLSAWLMDGDTNGWEGHEEDAAECSPTDEEIRNGGYKVVPLYHHKDTINSVALDLKDCEWLYGDLLADALLEIDVLP